MAMPGRALLHAIARTAFITATIGAYVFAIVPGSPGMFRSDKFNHILAFVTLSFLARLGWPRASARLLLVALVSFGAFIELSQAMPIIHRDASWRDLIADSLAVLPGLLAAHLVLSATRRAS